MIKEHDKLEMSEAEHELISELVGAIKKLNNSLAEVSDSVGDVRASINRLWRRVEE